MRFFETITSLSMLFVAAASSKTADEQGRDRQFAGFPGSGGGIGGRNSVECKFQGEPPFVTEEYVLMRYDGAYNFSSLADIIALDAAFVQAYNANVNCTVPGAERDMFDAEFLQVDFNTSTFLFRVGFFCNSCSEFKDISDETCREAFGDNVPYQVAIFSDLLFATTDAPGKDDCVCGAPESADVVALTNSILGDDGFTITSMIELCPNPQCERQQFVTTYSLTDGVCLAVDLLPLTAEPSEFPR
mmetsp:Transcript_32656/g.79348  ORF Transcript_32656/g.79348 Transcript_32656/m.79348 type:complete len:245 (-) Transcript_32656:556-1290(-)